MRTILAALMMSIAVLGSRALPAIALAEEQIGSQPGSGFTTVLASAMRYTTTYEQRFALLAAEEVYVQELQRPPNPGSNLSRSNPGGGMQAGGPIIHQTIKSDYLLVQLGMDGEGWMPFLRVTPSRNTAFS